MKNLALLLALLLGCPSVDAPDDDDDVATDPAWHALLTHAPFSGDAVLATVAVDDRSVQDGLLGLSGSDWGAASADGDPWLIGRFFIDTVRRYSGLDFTAPTLEFSTGPGTNPHDLAVCAERLYVTRYDLTEDGSAGGDVAIFDPVTGGPIGRVDLGDYDPHGDGTPEPDRLVVVDDLLYVSLQRIDRPAGWALDPVGQIVAIDCATGDVVDAWDVGSNPSLSGSGDRLVVLHEDGVDLFSPSDGSITSVVDDVELLGGRTTAGFAAAGDFALVVTELDGADSDVWCVDLTDGERTLLTQVPQVAWRTRSAPDGTVWVLWRDHWGTPSEVEPGGVAVYDPVACEEVTGGWLTFDADPYTLAFHEVPE